MGALIPLALTLAPEIGKWLFGSTGEKTGAAVAQVASAVTGVAEADAAAAAINADPKLAAQLRIELAKLAAQAETEQHQADIADLTARLADVRDARAQTVALSKDGSAIAWAPAIVTLVVLATFGFVMWTALTRTLPAGSEALLNVLLGTLATMATSVVAYWVGKGSSHDRMTDMLYRSTPAADGRLPSEGASHDR